MNQVSIKVKILVFNFHISDDGEKEWVHEEIFWYFFPLDFLQKSEKAIYYTMSSSTTKKKAENFFFFYLVGWESLFSNIRMGETSFMPHV